MLDKIKWLHVEPTTRCNASCPSCGRNNLGIGLKKSLVIEDLSVDRLEEVVSNSPNLQHVIFCGNLGDPCASKTIDKQLNVIFKRKNITLQLQTNGSLRNKQWWENLAKKFTDRLEVWFALDGLEDTHSYYRQGTSFNKIIDNAKSFIEGGGKAIWQFIPFAHNEHQIKDCIKLSQKIGFKEFRFIKDARYNEKSYHYKTGKEIDIKPWSKHHETWIRKNNGYLNTIQNKSIAKTKIKNTDCVHLVFPSVFLDAHGRLHPCCMLKNIDLNSVDIADNFEKKKWRQDCMKFCGS